MDDQRFQSMLATKRSFDQIFICSNPDDDDEDVYKISDDTIETSSIGTSAEFERLKLLLLVKFESSVKKLSWRSIELSLSEFVKVFSLTPQLEDLEIVKSRIHEESKF